MIFQQDDCPRWSTSTAAPVLQMRGTEAESLSSSKCTGQNADTVLSTSGSFWESGRCQEEVEPSRGSDLSPVPA